MGLRHEPFKWYASERAAIPEDPEAFFRQAQKQRDSPNSQLGPVWQVVFYATRRMGSSHVRAGLDVPQAEYGAPGWPGCAAISRPEAKAQSMTTRRHPPSASRSCGVFMSASTRSLCRCMVPTPYPSTYVARPLNIRPSRRTSPWVISGSTVWPSVQRAAAGQCSALLRVVWVLSKEEVLGPLDFTKKHIRIAVRLGGSFQNSVWRAGHVSMNLGWMQSDGRFEGIACLTRTMSFLPQPTQPSPMREQQAACCEEICGFDLQMN